MVRESERKDWYGIVDNEGIIVVDNICAVSSIILTTCDKKLYDNVNAALTEIKRLGELR